MDFIEILKYITVGLAWILGLVLFSCAVVGIITGFKYLNKKVKRILSWVMGIMLILSLSFLMGWVTCFPM